MHRKLVVTLSTVHGSRQITLSQIARYFVLAMLCVAGASFALSNYLLVRATESLETLEGKHTELFSELDSLNYELEQISEERDSIKARYDVAIGSQQLYLSELDALTDRLFEISQEREYLLGQTDELSYQIDVLDQVAEEKLSLEEEKVSLQEEKVSLEMENQALSIMLGNLSESLGFGALQAEASLEDQANWLEAAARERLFMMHAIPNGTPAQSERINSRFGNRIHPVSGKKAMHRGIDLKMPIGTPVYATADGIVEAAGKEKNSGFGNIIRIQHGFGFRTYFAHLSKVQVQSGQYVQKGQQIGLSGNTGRSTGPHLHYEVRRLWSALDPEPFMDWSLTNFEQLFDDVKEVDWESLGKLYPLRVARLP